MTTVFHVWSYGGFIVTQSTFRRKKFHRSNQGFNFRGGVLNSRHNVRASIQFRRESQPQHLKVYFFLKNRPTHFHINSTSVIRPIKLDQLRFSVKINKSLPSWSITQCFINQVQIQKPILVAATNHMPDHT